MQKYYIDLDDFEDDSRPSAMDLVYWLLPRLIMVGGIWLMLMVCAALEGM